MFELEETDDAVRAWWRAKTAAEGDPSTLASLGVGLWVTGEQDEALRLWRRAMEREPSLRQNWQWAQQEEAWGPRMIGVAKEIAAALSVMDPKVTEETTN